MVSNVCLICVAPASFYVSLIIEYDKFFCRSFVNANLKILCRSQNYVNCLPLKLSPWAPIDAAPTIPSSYYFNAAEFNETDHFTYF